MNVEPDKKIVGFTLPTNLSESFACHVCGSHRVNGEICSTCQVRLIDLALSSVDEEFPQAVSDLGDDSGHENLATDFDYDHYRICRLESGLPWELGRGAMGVTYKATDTHLNCTVALKLINARHLTQASVRARFLHEARTAARLRHPNIASIFHLGLGDENCFYAMEYIEGETLDERIRREGALPVATALNIVLQCARALRVAHDRRFVHRDIKPTNIMLVNDEHVDGIGTIVKVIDFGLVTAAVDSEARDGYHHAYFAGTPHYASPEQLRGSPVDARSDIYSLGKCLLYMLTGEPPVAGTTVASSLPGVASLGLPPSESSPTIPERVAALVNAMVAREPSSRPASAATLIQQVTECLVATGVAETHEIGRGANRAMSIRRAWKRPPRPFIGSLLAFAVIGILTLKFSFMSNHHLGTAQDTEERAVSAQARSFYSQGTALYQKHSKEDMQRAVEFYLKAVALSPDFADAHAALANACYENVARFGAPASELETAVSSAHRAMTLEPTNPNGFQTLGAILGFQGQPWEALKQVSRALELNPKASRAMCDFSLLWTSVGQPQYALPWARAATQIDPASIPGWHAAAEASVDLCADEQAEAYYRHCLEIKPMWMSAHCGLIHLHLIHGDFEQARRDMALADSIQPGQLLATTLSAQIELFSGNNAKAEEIYRHLVGMNRRGYASYYSGISYLSALGYLRMAAGDADQAKTFLDEAAGLHVADSDGPAGIYDLAAVRAIEGRAEDSLALLHQAITSGWKDHRATLLDPRFQILRLDSRFKGMLAALAAEVHERREEAEALCARPINLADYPVQPPQK